MVANSIRTIGIIVACVIASILIGTAFLISGPLPSFFGTANAESTHDLLVQYAAKDSDHDGLPDWEEALYGTDPNNPHSISPTLTDGEAVAQGLVKPAVATATSSPAAANSIPGASVATTTVTDEFARELFSQYLLQLGPNAQPTPDDVATFVEQGLANLSTNQQVPDAYNAGQVRVVGSGSDALISYAAAEESAFSKNTIKADRSEIDYFADAVNKNDASALVEVKRIGAAYTALGSAYLAVPVPQEAAVPHLAIANALARLGGDITDMSMLGSDPLRSYLGLAKYENDASNLQKALVSLHDVYASERVVIPDGTTGVFFYALLQKSAAPAPGS